MFRVALLWIFKQETMNPNNAYKHQNSEIKSERYIDENVFNALNIVGFRSLHLELYSLYPVRQRRV